MSFKANPYTLRISHHQNWQNFNLSNLSKQGLSKNVLIEQFIRSTLYEKDIYVVDCQVIANSLGNYNVFFTYFSFFKYRVHKLKPLSKLHFKSKFNLFKEPFKKIKKSKYKFFFYKRYAKKLLKRKKKVQKYKTRLIGYTLATLTPITKNISKSKSVLLVKRCWLVLFKKIKSSLIRNCVRTYKVGSKFFLRKFYKKFRWVRKQRKQRKNRNRLNKRIKQKRFFNVQKIVFEPKMLSLFFSQKFEKLFNLFVKVTARNIRKQIPPAVKLLNKKAIQLFSYRFRTLFIIDLIQTFHLSIFFKKPEFVLRLIALNLKNKRRRQLTYLKQVLNVFLTCYLIFGSLRGLKFQVKGRINKALRTQTFAKTIGQMPTQSIGANICYSQIWVTDRVGSYSLQLWYYI